MARLADSLHLTFTDLLTALEVPVVPRRPSEVDELDQRASPQLLAALNRRTGVDLDRLRIMTFHGWVPWLLETVEPEGDSSAFNVYVRQHSVLLPRSKISARKASRWRPWQPVKPPYSLSRACPICRATPGSGLSLMAQVPLMLSCPLHGCHLETFHGYAGVVFSWEKGLELPEPRPARAQTVTLDRRTWQAFTQGFVNLPGRPVHAAVWFRLVRTLLEELSRSVAGVGAQGSTIERIWNQVGYPVRAGQSSGRLFEQMPWPAQQQMLEAVAVTVELIEIGTIEAKGVDRAAFLPPTYPPVLDGTMRTGRPWLRRDEVRSEPLSSWSEIHAALAEVTTQARQDPAVAVTLFRMCLFGRTDPADISDVDHLLAECGIPPAYLSLIAHEDRSQVVD